MLKSLGIRSLGNRILLTCTQTTPFSTTSPLGAVATHRRKTVTLIPGDGVWPELFVNVKHIIREANVPIDFEEVQLSGLPGVQTSSVDAVAASLKKTKVGLKGIIRSPVGSLEQNTVNMRMRRLLDMYANVVHIRSLPGIPCKYGELDFVIIREQLEGEYSCLEHQSVPGVVECLKIMTRHNCERIAKFAFDYAVRMKRNTVTAVHKANIMKLGDGLFLETCQRVAKLYPHVNFNSMIIDNCCMQLVSHPQQFDVMVMPNLYGNIVDNLAAGLVGGAGVVPGVTYGHEIALFEPGTRHSYAEAAGRDVADPTAILLASCQLLHHINLHEHAIKLESAIFNVINSGQWVPRDLGGRATTTEYTHAIMSELHSRSNRPSTPPIPRLTKKSHPSKNLKP